MEPAAEVVPSVQPRRAGTLRRLWQSGALARWPVFVGGALTLFFVLLAIFAPLISRYRFDQYRTAAGVHFPTLAGPSGAHWLGTTVQATDVFSHVVYGSRTAIEVVVLAVVISVVVGVPAGLASGFIGGALDRVLVLVMDALFAFPFLLLAILVAFLLANSIGHGILTAAFAITVVYVPQYFRVVRNNVMSVREEPFVEAARALGAPRRTIIRRYIFPNIVQNLPVIASLNAADGILTLAGLGFLGYGIQPTQAAEWGYDLQRAVSDVAGGIWWTALAPGLSIVLLVTGLTLLGEGLNDAANPLLRQRRLRPPSIAAEREA